MTSASKRRGAAFVARVVNEHELSAGAEELVTQAAALIDSIAALDAIVAREGYMSTSSQGARVHPALTEARSARTALHAILRTLALPVEVE